MDINSAFNMVGYQLQMTHFLSNCEHQLARCRFLVLHSTTLNRKVCSSVLAYTKMAQRKGQFVVLFCLVKNSWYYFFSFCPFKRAQSSCSLNACRLYATGQPHTITLDNNRETSEKNESAALEPIFPDKTVT